MDRASNQEQITFFGEKAKFCKTDHQKIEFFDSCQEAFLFDSNNLRLSENKSITKDIDDAFYVYANMKKMNERELYELKDRKWLDFPKVFKIFLFDFCILNGDIYSKFFID